MNEGKAALAGGKVSNVSRLRRHAGKSIGDECDSAGNIAGESVVVDADVERSRKPVSLTIEPVEPLDLFSNV